MGKLSTVISLGQAAASVSNSGTSKSDMGRAAGRQAFAQGTSVGKTAGKTYLKTFETIPRLVCRCLQFVLALIVIGFYGHRVDVNRKTHTAGAEFLFAVVIAGLSAVSSVVFLALGSAGAIPGIGGKLKAFKTYRAFAWDATLAIGWLVVFGIFAGIFLKRKSGDSYKGASVPSMKTAVWFDLVNVIFWLGSAGYGAFKTFVGRKVDSTTDKVGDRMFTKRDVV